MSGLQAYVDDYLRLRRALGFKLKEDERVLGQLVGYLEAAGAEAVSSELAIGWARQPEGVHPNHWAKRLRIARGFASYLQTIDPRSHRRVRRQRATPYLFSQQDICRLMVQTRRCVTRCARRATRRCSGCWRCLACGSVRRSRSSARTSTLRPA
jgi:integrase/recombinase XerD